MVYNPNIPGPNDKLRVSQGQILENFSQADTLFDVDHVKFSDTTGDAGKHTATTFVNRTDKALTIPPTTSAQELALYVKDDAAGTPRIFYQEPDSAGAGAEQQLSGNVVVGTDGEVPLIGGCGLKWMQLLLISTIPQTITYVGKSLTAFSVNTFSVSTQIDNGTGTVSVSSVDKDGFGIIGIFAGGGTKTVYVSVIGQ